MADEKIFFVIATFGDPDPDTTKRSDRILRDVIHPAVASGRYKAVHVDEIDQPGIILRQVIQHAVNNPLIIADFTEHNPNALYELSVRHVARTALITLFEGNKLIDLQIKHGTCARKRILEVLAADPHAFTDLETDA